MGLSTEISNVKPCELKTALSYIHLETSPDLCKNRAIAEASTSLKALSIAEIILNLISFFHALLAFVKESFQSRFKISACVRHYCVSDLYILCCLFVCLGFYVPLDTLYYEFIHHFKVL